MLCPFIKKIDLYGKDPEFYFKGNSNKTTWIGRILTILYVIIYISFLIYKLERMVSRVDVTFYDTYAYTGEVPSIQLNKDTFYGAFAFDDPITNLPYANESIYHINAKFVRQIKENGIINTTETKISFKHCELSDFGPEYQKIVGNRNISGMWCPTNVDFVLEGYTTLDRYSYFKMNFAPCRDYPGSNVKCGSTQELLDKLYATSISSIIEDLELIPRDHDNPVQPLERDIPGPTFLNLYQMIYVYMQLVIVETDDNIIGFEALSNTKVQKFLKYETSWIISRPVLFGNIFENPETEDLNDITIQLSPNVLTQKRKYVQLIDVLGDVGGLMEIVNMIFSVIASLIVNILYEKSLVNNLFNFDLEKKLVVLKVKKNLENKEIKENKENKENSQSDNSRRKLNTKLNTLNLNNKNEEISSKNKFMEHDIIISKKNKSSNDTKKETNNTKKILKIYHKKNEPIEKDKNDNNNFNDMNSDCLEKKIEDIENIHNESKEKNEQNKNIITKIKVNTFYVHCGFCCVRGISNLNNILLDEGMKLITEQLDVLNIFRKLYIEEKGEKKLKEKIISVEMSDECRNDIVEKIMELNISYPV